VHKRAPLIDGPRGASRVLVVCLLLGWPGAAISGTAADDEVVVTGPPSSCVHDAPGPQPARSIDYGCITRELAQKGHFVPPTVPSPAAQAHIPSRVGTFSYTATAQRMGSGFGKGVTPQRPPAPTYSSVTIAGRVPRRPAFPLARSPCPPCR
jgi:hypothetical protein